MGLLPKNRIMQTQLRVAYPRLAPSAQRLEGDGRAGDVTRDTQRCEHHRSQRMPSRLLRYSFSVIALAARKSSNSLNRSATGRF